MRERALARLIGMRLDIAGRAVLSGANLSAGTIEWGRRPTPMPTVALTDRDRQLMSLLHGANFLSASQLVMLG